MGQNRSEGKVFTGEEQIFQHSAELPSTSPTPSVRHHLSQSGDSNHEVFGILADSSCENDSFICQRAGIETIRDTDSLIRVVSSHPINYGTVSTGSDPPTTATPVPYAQILPLCLSRIAEGIIFTVVYPYINEMIQRMGVEERSAGVWSAMAESVLSLTEALAGPLFAPLGDRYGRRPVNLACVFSLGLGASLYGIVGTPWSAVFARGLIGLPAGAGVLGRTMAAELSDTSNRIRIFALFSPSSTFGSSLGPILGGFLATPVPRLLPPSFTIFTIYPYLLPALVAGLTGFSAWVFGYIFLPETLPTSLRIAKDDEAGTDLRAKPKMGHLLRHKPFQRVLVLYGFANTIQSCFDAIYPLFAFSQIDLGGLELPTYTIGIIVGFSAGLSIFMTTTLFPILHRIIPQDTYLTLCLLCYALAALFFPLVYAINQASAGPGLGWYTIVVMSLQMIIRQIGAFSLTMLDAMLFEEIPSPSFLVKANSLTFSVGGLGRAVGPFFISYFFSLSTHYPSDHPARQVVWVAFVILGLSSVWISWTMRASEQSTCRSTSDGNRADEECSERTGLLP